MRMCLSCASVSMTLLGVRDAFWELSGPHDTTSATAHNSAAIARTGDGEKVSVVIFVPGQIGSMPPAAAQRLEQCGGVRVTVCFRLHERDMRLLVALLGGEELQISGVSVAHLPFGDVERVLRGLVGDDSGLQRVRILLQ